MRLDSEGSQLMRQTVFKETILQLIRNTKNRLAIALVFLAVIFYSFFMLPQQKSFDTIDYDKLEIDLFAHKGIMEDSIEKGNFRVNSFTGQSAYSQAKYNYDNQHALISAINNGDADRYISIISRYTPQFHVEDRMDSYMENSLYPGKDMTYDSMNFNNRITSYTDNDIPLTFSIIQEKTSWQQLQIFFLEWGPLLLVALTLFIASDVFTESIKKRTQRIGVPLGWGQYLFIQSLAILSFVGLFFLAGGLFFFTLNGLLNGFGDLNWSVSQFNYSDSYVTDTTVYGLMQLKDFFIQTLPFMAILLYLFVRLSTLFSLLFRQEVVVFLAGIFTFLFERLYFSRTTRDLLGIDISYFPQTYFDFGKVINGHQNFLINTGTITVEKGLISLLVTIVAVEVILAFVIRLRSRQKFIG